MSVDQFNLRRAQIARRPFFDQLDNVIVSHLSPSLFFSFRLVSSFSTASRIRRRARKACVLTFDSDQPVISATCLTGISAPSSSMSRCGPWAITSPARGLRDPPPPCRFLTFGGARLKDRRVDFPAIRPLLRLIQLCSLQGAAWNRGAS